MITIINPTRLTRQPFFKDLINYLDQQNDVILRQIKAQFPDQPVDKLMEEYIKAGLILRENKRYRLNLPFLESADPAIEVFEEAMNNIMPVLEVKARRSGGATYQVPIEVKPDRRQALALRWMTSYSRARGEKTMEERLANEILDAANNTGASVKKKEDMHKMAEANKAFAHYRF